MQPDLGQRFPWRAFLRQVAAIAIPVALQNLLTTTGSMVDTMMLATLGQNTVGAVGLCAQFSSLMFSGIWGFVGGGMLFFSQFFGAEDNEGINRSYGITWSCMMTVGLLFGSLALFAPQWIINLYTDKQELHVIGMEYLRVVGFAYPLQVYSMCMASLLRTTQRVRIPLYGAICSVVCNITFNALLIPKMGVRGAALATVIGNGVNVAVLLVLGLRSHHPNLLAVRQHFRWTGEALGLYFRKCAPILANEILIGVGNMVINVVLGRQSVEAIAALAVFRTLEGCVIGFFAGFSNAASVLVGVEVGAGNLRIAWARAKRIVYLCSGIIFCAVALLFAVHTPLFHMMSLRGESFHYATGLLLIYGLASLIRMGNWCMNDTYRSAGDAVTGTLLEIIFMYVMVLPLVYFSGMVWHWPFLLVFAMCYADEPIRYVIMQIHLYSGRWIRPVTEQGIAALEQLKSEIKQKA